MTKMFYFPILFVMAFMLTACNGGSVASLQNATGSPYEVLFVAKPSLLNGPVGEEVKSILNSDVPGLPQSESEFRVSPIPSSEFDKWVKPVRNILIVEVSELTTQAKLSMASNVWSQGQMVLYLKGPSQESILEFLPKNKQTIIDFFVNSELNRVIKFLRTNSSVEASEELFNMLGVEMKLPKDVNNVYKGKDFFWASNDGLRARTDIVVYALPYTSVDAFTLKNIIATRDSVMKANIPGPVADSYMTTSMYVMPELTEKDRYGDYMAEVRGLWEVEGDAMGGPFVSHTLLDEANQRIITAEAFVFAPEKSKRNLMRSLEAALYTLKLPQENLLPEVPIMVSK